MDTPEDIQLLMMAAIDNEIDDGGQQRLEAYLADHPAERDEYERMRSLAQRTSRLRYVEPPAEAWDSYMNDLRPHLTRKVGYGLLAVGIGGMVAAAVLLFLSTPAIPVGIKLVGGAALAGFGALFISVWREKRYIAAGERYGRIRR